jgi:outer membrane protein assembly factor BamB
MIRRTLMPVAFFLAVACARGEDWPGWRGPRGDGTSRETGVPLRWGRTENVAWKTPIPGAGHSSPIVWGDRVFVTTCVEDRARQEGKRMLFCLDRRDGQVLWERVVLTAKLERKHRLNSFASYTPATDGQHVWVSFLAYPDMRVACYDFDGKRVWQRSPGQLLSVHGFCTSPVLHKDLVILNGDQDAKAYLVALDKNTGAERWRADRPNRTRSYCTPILIESPGRPGVTQLVLSGSRCVTGYDADTGKLLWIIDGPTEQYVASLVYGNGILFLTTGFPRFHLMGISPEGSGNITRSRHVLWHIPHAVNGPKGASYVPSPIAHDGHFFVVSDLGYLSCLEARTGKRLWMERLGRHHSASPVRADGHLFFPADDGTTFVLKAGSTFEVVRKNSVGEECSASPAVSHGQLFLRTVHHLYCIGANKAPAAE